MKDPTLVRGFVFGTVATILMFAAVTAFGHLPRQTMPVMTCLCPDSASTVQPRSFDSNQRN